ncbi:Histone-lysine N-methyltransferase, H3 lysine-9 specific SUVH5 [Triticum urartu]|uniref:Histone-lysine N-methyltransferase, H3 lysine-9 specific SUVH5 n=1 Tax=Triticum urartu TaxID=4572 RepID=M7Z6L6_TRIUA|nr:Histone-lysine N-methyltransferase, H3 lysine-9 specific SUVH5 [Triticum urartu]
MAALPRPSPHPLPPPYPLAAGGGDVRVRSEAEVARGRRQGGGDGAEREEVAVTVGVAVAAGGDDVAVSGGFVGDSAAGVSGLVALEERGCGGGELQRKRGLEFPARPPPKRRAVSAVRHFPPGCGGDAPPLIVGGDDDGLPAGTAPSSGARPAGSSAREECGLPLQIAPGNAGVRVLEKVTASDGGAPVSDGDHRGPEAVAVKSSDGTERGADLVVKDRGRTRPISRLLAKRRVISANRRFPPGCGRDAVVSLASRGGGESSLHFEALPPAGDLGALEDGRRSNVCAMDTIEAVSENALDAIVDVQDLEEGEIPPEPDHVLQEFPVTHSNIMHELTADGLDEKISVNMLQRKGESVSWEVVEDLKVMNKCEGSSPKAASKPSAEGPLKEHLGDTTEAVSKNALDVIVEVQELEEGEIRTEPHHVLQENPVTHNNSLHELTAGTLECVVPSMVDAEPSVRHFSNEKIPVNMLEHKGESVSWEVAEDLKVMNKCEGNSPKGACKPPPEDPLKEYLGDKKVSESCSMKSAPLDVEAGVHGDGIMRRMVTITARKPSPEQGNPSKGASKPSPEDPLKEYLGDKEVSESCSMKRASLDVAAGVHGDGIMRRMVSFTARKTFRLPVEANHKSALVNLDRPCSMGKEKESVVTMSESFAPRKKLKIKGPAQSKYLPMNTISSKEKLKHEEASHLEDDEVLNAIAVHEGKFEMYLNDPSWRHMQHGGQTADARSKVRMICRRFQFICRTLVQAVEQGSLKSRRIDLAADKLIRKLPGFTKQGPIVGKVPGVEIGDEFLYRVELAIVGLHRPYQGGIDTTKDINDMPIAISVVASGGYPDDLSSSGEIIYTGSGGKPAGKKENEDQKLVRGNLALKNCIKTKTPVRVIHGFKGPNREEGSHSKAKEVSIFTYDGLYHVVQCWQEGLPGSRVFKYRLQRISGQPELPLHVAKVLRKSAVRPGLCIADISQGKEKIPICVVNNIDAARPASFKYITRIKGSSLAAKRSHQGCDCTNGCSDSASCACAVKNGGEFPFNFNGAVVHAKPLIYECGPSCRCPPSCHSRVSQHGMKIPLEVFRTTKTGWGVRSLRSISAGSFICEYVGELLHSDEANQRMNDEYLFDIGHNYDIWKGMPSVVPGLSSSAPRSVIMDDDRAFTIDAAEYGNIGRFINHSCSPNLYAQNILWDHGDKRVPHIMFFAAENISPLQELTYDYNYEIDHVRDMNGEVKVKYCHCGSPQCRDRLY